MKKNYSLLFIEKDSKGKMKKKILELKSKRENKNLKKILYALINLLLESLKDFDDSLERVI